MAVTCRVSLCLYLPSSQSAANQRAATGFGQSQGPTHRAAGFTKIQLRLLQMEDAAFNQGLSRTHLTPERLSTALSVIMSKGVTKSGQKDGSQARLLE